MSILLHTKAYTLDHVDEHDKSSLYLLALSQAMFVDLNLSMCWPVWKIFVKFLNNNSWITWQHQKLW